MCPMFWEHLTACAQPCEKEIFDFVFEHGKGNAHFCVYWICIITNNRVYKLSLSKTLTIYKFTHHYLFLKNYSNYYPSWRQDIVVSYDTTYASRYVDRLPFSKIYLNPYLRGYFDEMRRKLNFWLRRFSGGRIRRTVPLRRRLQFSTFNLRRYLRGISDEKRLDEIFWIEAY